MFSNIILDDTEDSDDEVTSDLDYDSKGKKTSECGKEADRPSLAMALDSNNEKTQGNA